MGNKSSSPRDGGSWRQSSMTQSSSPSPGWQHDYGQAPYSQYAQTYPVQNPYPPPQNQYYAPPSYASPSHPPQNSRPSPQLHVPQKKLDRRYSRIADNYNSLEEVCIWLRAKESALLAGRTILVRVIQLKSFYIAVGTYQIQ